MRAVQYGFPALMLQLLLHLLHCLHGRCLHRGFPSTSTALSTGTVALGIDSVDDRAHA